MAFVRTIKKIASNVSAHENVGLLGASASSATARLASDRGTYRIQSLGWLMRPAAPKTLGGRQIVRRVDVERHARVGASTSTNSLALSAPISLRAPSSPVEAHRRFE